MTRTSGTTTTRHAVAAAVATAVAAALALTACTAPTAPGPVATSLPAPGASAGAPALRDVAPAGVLVGTAAAGGGHHAAAGTGDPIVVDEAYRALVAAQFSSLTPENQMKWAVIHPDRTRYDFAAADAVVDFAAAHGQAVRGHNLLWHQQNPAWLTDGHFTDDEMRAILKDHVTTVVGHFRGRVATWDVANEILADDGTLRTAENPFLHQLGIEAVDDAFRWAHEADPAAVLYLNDYNVESSAAKRDAYVTLVNTLLAQGVPVGGFGVQGHLSLQYPFPAAMQDTLSTFANLGLDVAISELDVRMPVVTPPTTEQLAQQADYFGRAVSACLAVPRCRSITVWGLPDTYSWVPSVFPAEGAATPWNDDLTPKPAVAAMADALRSERA